MSESDYPFQVFEIEGTANLSLQDTPQILRRLACKTWPVETRPLERFFWPDTDNAFPELVAAISRTLDSPYVIRAGEIQIDCVVVGRLENGNLGGLKTVSIET